MRIGVDVGGTFTDVVCFGDAPGETWATKTDTTPRAPADGVLAGIAKVLKIAARDRAAVRAVVHGTTIGTNALIEKKGAKTGLLTTKGFRDVLEIGRIQRPDEGLYDVTVDNPPPLVPRHLRLEADERVGSKGEVVRPLDERSVAAAAKILAAEKVEAVAVTFLFGFLHPAHEERAAAILRKALPGVAISLASHVAPEFREFERTSTTVLDAYLKPKMDEYLRVLAERVGREVGSGVELRLMQASGGSMDVAAARERPIRTVNSGPAGGAVAAALIARLADAAEVVSVDMGGTSFDIGVILGGRPAVASEGSLEGYPVKMPLIDATGIGAGGGSIAWIDRGGALNVGPESASAQPGPACYGRGGTRPTVTDANVVLGRVNPAYFLGGEMRLDVAAARRAIETHVSTPLRLSVEEAAAGIVRVVNANMVKGIGAKTTKRGLDVRSMSLVAFGGAGPLHAAELGADLGMRRVLVPPFCSAFSAFGLAAADQREDLVAVVMRTRKACDPAALYRVYADLTSRGLETMAPRAGGADRVRVEWGCDMRYEGQSYELTVPVPRTANPFTAADLDRVVAEFNATHERIYAFGAVDEEVELVNARVVCTVPAGPAHFPRPAEGRDVAAARKGEREVFFPERGRLATTVYERDRLPLGVAVAGPCLVEEPASTTVVPPGWSAAPDAHGILRVSAA